MTTATGALLAATVAIGMLCLSFAELNSTAGLGPVDAVLFVTPEYNRSIPGALKNAIDWASRPALASPLAGKPVAIMGATTGCPVPFLFSSLSSCSLDFFFLFLSLASPRPEGIRSLHKPRGKLRGTGRA